MKKIIILASLLLCMFCLNLVDASAGIYVTVDNDVEADITYEVVVNEDDKTIVYLYLNGDENVYFDDSLIGENVNHWFSEPLDGDENLMPTPFNDLPSGLDAYVLGIEDNKATIEISGIVADSNEKGEYQICVAVPGDVVWCGDDLYGDSDDYIYSNLSLSSALYKLYEPVVTYKGPYIVSGVVGEVLTPQIVVVTINNESLLKADLTTSLNQTLPIVNGLIPTITSVSDKEYTITYTGVPIETSQDLIHTTILKDYLSPNAQDKIVPDRIDVKFDIIDKVPQYIEPIEENYIAPITGVE